MFASFKDYLSFVKDVTVAVATIALGVVLTGVLIAGVILVVKFILGNV